MEVFDDALFDYLDDDPGEEDFFDKADRLHDERIDRKGGDDDFMVE